MSATHKLISCSVVPPLANSDHNGIHLTLSFSSPTPLTSTPRKVCLYSQADFEHAVELLYSFDWSALLFCKNINECWSIWHSTFLQIMEECIPRRQLPAKRNHPWFNSSIARAARKRNYFHRRATKFWRNRVTSEIRTSKRKYFDTHLNGTCRKRYWQAVKYLRGEKSSIPSLKVDAVNVITDIDKANALNEFFSECFNSPLPPLNNDDWNNIRTNPDECPTDIMCSENEVLEMLCSLNTRKSNGPDGISARMLKSCAGSISLPIKMIFNHSIRSGQLPCAWKESNVTLIPKSTGSGTRSGYRPISLLSILSKELERHISHKICAHLAAHNPLSASVGISKRKMYYHCNYPHHRSLAT